MIEGGGLAASAHHLPSKRLLAPTVARVVVLARGRGVEKTPVRAEPASRTSVASLQSKKNDSNFPPKKARIYLDFRGALWFNTRHGTQMFHVEHQPNKHAMSTPNTPAPATLQLTFRADVRNPRTYTATEGANAGKTYYTADAELATPGARWSTIRIKVRSKTPIVAGPANLLMVTMDGSKGEGVADILPEA